MPSMTNVLRNLHRLHICLSDLRNSLARGPRMIAIREANVAQIEKTLAQSHETAKTTRMAVDRKQLDLQSGEDRIADWKTKLNACSTNKEYQTLIDQVSAAEMANGVLEDEILEGLDRIETTDSNVVETERMFKAGKEELDKARRQIAEEAETIRGDIARQEQELAEVEKCLPTDSRANYQRLIKARGEDSLAPVDNEVCTGCGHKITLNMQNDLRLDRAILCKSCGRFLYLPEEVGSRQ